MRAKFFIIGIAIIITVIVVINFFLNRNNVNIDWIKDLNYEVDQVHGVSASGNAR